GIRRTVADIKAHPTDPEKIAEIRKFYDIEDRLAEIYGTAASAAAALDHDEADYHHAYAHPRERGLERDHRNR
ncbi:MAG: hypothetical protein VXV97_16145, partial [Pseudomonadota bacterium]|nr:hypothetical protein [Pseudomonadota bacterium]